MLSDLRAALIEAGASPASADKAAIEAAGYDTRLNDVTQQMGDLRREMTEFRAEVRAEITDMRGEIRLLRWAQGATFAGVLAVLLKLFLH